MLETSPDRHPTIECSMPLDTSTKLLTRDEGKPEQATLFLLQYLKPKIEGGVVHIYGRSIYGGGRGIKGSDRGRTPEPALDKGRKFRIPSSSVKGTINDRHAPLKIDRDCCQTRILIALAEWAWSHIYYHVVAAFE